jgi:protein-disulfide isomerase
MQKITKFYIFLYVGIFIAGSFFAYQVYKAKNITVNQTGKDVISNGYYDIPLDKAENVLGNPGAPLTIVMFSNYSCSECTKQLEKIENFVNSNPQSVRMFLKHIPKDTLLLKADNRAEKAVYCAGKQDRFWNFSDMVLKNKNFEESNLNNIASLLKINTTDWQNCFNSQEPEQNIKDNTELAKRIGVEELPAIFINNKKINIDKDIDITDMLSKFISPSNQ